MYEGQDSHSRWRGCLALVAAIAVPVLLVTGILLYLGLRG